MCIIGCIFLTFCLPTYICQSYSANATIKVFTAQNSNAVIISGNSGTRKTVCKINIPKNPPKIAITERIVL